MARSSITVSDRHRAVRRRRAAIGPIVVALALACFSSRVGAQDRPNVLFILTDDQRWDTVGLEPESVVATPHLDRLGRDGLRFANHFCTTSLCSPSRASILTGLYPHAHGVRDNFTEYPESLDTWPKALQRAGYRTAYFGKYHMGEDNDEVRGGFDRFVTHRGQGKYFDTEFRFDGGERRVIPGYYTTVVTDLAEAFVREQADAERPWAMIVGHKAPHSFYVPEPKYEHAFDHVNVAYPPSAFELDDNADWYRQRTATWHGIYGPLFDFRKEWPDRSAEGAAAFARMVRSYWGTILSVDDSVGRLVAALERTGQLERTLIIFTSDNGLLEGEHGMIDKRTAHEPSMRIPLIVRLPRDREAVSTEELEERSDEAPRPRVVERMTSTVDFAPSILEICGANPIDGIHGRSWHRLALGQEDPEWRTSLYYAYDYERQFPYTPNVRAVRTERWKLIRYPHGDGGPDRHKGDLFDLANDPEERRNRIDDPALADVVAELDAELRSLQRRLGALPDRMPIDEGIGSELPDASIR